ncbi:hypothetical protein [Thalassolituus sp. C2-1]|uniref:hypothetical protein n=1 Tax=Venatorbacter sp. C2-1 TaxID=2597518 RepID=UPI00119409FA|nr:hypothetical protein [Thalassolituus sp. C2-1]TVV42248.1 hypothetical protein FOT50_16830 [Thalassolituus sp. C2-1]
MRVNQRILAMFFPLTFMISVLWIYFASPDHPNSGLPDKFELEEKEGALSVINNSKYVKGSHELILSFSGDNNSYLYPDKAGNSGKVYAELLKLRGQTITALCERASNFMSADYESNRRCYEFRAGDQMIRSYEEVEAAWKADSALAPYAVLLIVVMSLGLLIVQFRRL